LIEQGRSEYADKGGKELFWNVVYRILIPTILFSLIEYAPKHILRGECLSFHTLLSNTIGGGTYWFTSALVVSELVLLLLLFSRKSNIWFYVVTVLIAAIIGYWLVQIDFHIFGLGRDPWAYRRGLIALGYLVIGGLYWRYESVISKMLNIYFVIALLIVYVFIFVDKSHNARASISLMSINWLGYLASLLGCVVLIQLCKLLKPLSFLTFIGQNSLCFYFLSGGLPMVLSMVEKRFMGVDNWCGCLLVILLSIGLAYVITLLLSRYFPFVFDLRRLKRKYDKQ